MPLLAIITGASSGIGAEFAAQLASRGYGLLLVARRKDRLEETAAALSSKFRVPVEVLAADLTNDEGLAVVEEAIARAEGLGLLVNNAGFGTTGKFFKTSVESQDQMHRLHVLATMRLCHAVLARMVPQNQGGIINVSSVAAFWQSPGSVSYCATKGWMNSFTEGVAIELKAAGSAVKVQALCPGYTLSEFHDVASIDRNAIPASLWMKAEEVVADSLRGLDQGELIVVPGWRYKAGVFLMKHLPRALLRWAAVRSQRRLRRD